MLSSHSLRRIRFCKLRLRQSVTSDIFLNLMWKSNVMLSRMKSGNLVSNAIMKISVSLVATTKDTIVQTKYKLFFLQLLFRIMPRKCLHIRINNSYSSKQPMWLKKSNVRLTRLAVNFYENRMLITVSVKCFHNVIHICNNI